MFRTDRRELFSVDHARITPRAYKKERRTHRRSFSSTKNTPPISLHPLFIVVGLLYALQGNLFLFLLNCLVALQHELAHAFASQRLGYSLRTIVLMPFGALLKGDLAGISLQDEIKVAVCGPLCNLITAFFFGALWWFFPTLYAYTDTAYSVSLSVALVNLLPCYPLDGGRVLRAVLTSRFYKRYADVPRAERRAYAVCKAVSLSFGLALIGVGVWLCIAKQYNLSLFIFGIFLIVGGAQNTHNISYSKINFSQKNVLKRGVEVRRIAVSGACQVKDVFRFIQNGSYLVLDVYSADESSYFSLTQNQLSALFLQTATPYSRLEEFSPGPADKKAKELSVF